MYRDAILVDTQKWKYHYQMEHFVFVYVTHVDCYWLPHECTVTYSNPTVRCGLWGRPQASRLVTGIFFFPYHPHASTWKEFAFSCLKRYIFDCLLVALEALEKVYVTTSKINSHEVFSWCYLTFCSSCLSQDGRGCPSLCSSFESSTLWSL